MQAYSAFFKTLHDETNPTGYLGRGTHYSVLRAIVFHDPMGALLPEGQFADFAVVWDEDHDERVIESIEEIYRCGLLSSFVIFGERKGVLTAILSSKVAFQAPFDPALLRRVDVLRLSERTESSLKSENINYIGDLVQKTEAEVLRTPNFGRKSLNEIKERLAKIGLHLGMEAPGWPPKNIEELTKGQMRVKFLETEIDAICQSLNDPWSSEVVDSESPRSPIIDDEHEKVHLYLKNLEMLWQLGTVARHRPKPTALVSGEGRRIDRPARPAIADGNLPGWIIDPFEADNFRGE